MDLLLIHYVVIDDYFSEFQEESADQRGIKSASLFLSALMEPRQTFGGKDLYPDVLMKGAAYLRSFALNHAFHNGNKRTALLATIVFLEINGYECVADQRKLLRLARTVVIRGLSPKQIKEKYLKKYFRLAARRKRRLSFVDEHRNSISSWLARNLHNVKGWFEP